MHISEVRRVSRRSDTISDVLAVYPAMNTRRMAGAPIIVQVRGVPGAGKTYLRRLVTTKSVAWFDTDEYITRAYLGSKRFLRWDLLQDRARTLLEADIAACGARVAVCTGITLGSRADAAHSFFIKLNKTELGAAYRRLLIREVQKFIEAQRDIITHIETAPLKSLNVGLHAIWHLHAWWGSWHQYQQEYTGAVESESVRGRYRLLSQAKIAEAITRLAEGRKLPVRRPVATGRIKVAKPKKRR